MSVQHAGLTIQEARLKAGLTQEQLSEGICSPVSLSRIESGSAGVSPITFQALMSKAGAPCEAFPVFASRADFDCFYTLKRAKFYIDIWNLSKGYHELDKVETANFADNKFYYQEWLLLHSRLQFRSGCGNHQHIFETLSAAITISKPEIDFFDFRNLLFSTTEIELLIALAQEALYLSKLPMCLEICTQISAYLENSAFPFLERDNLLAANAIVYAKYLIAVKDYSMALEMADKYRKNMAKFHSKAYLHELTFLTGLGYFFTNEKETAIEFFLTAFYSAHSANNTFATIMCNYLADSLNFQLPNIDRYALLQPLTTYPKKIATKSTTLSDGTFDMAITEIFTLGKLIKERRQSLQISQQALCKGLCSKSMLSKIENNVIEPSIILLETLLQRLGLSDNIFMFFGNEKEQQLHALKLKLTFTPFDDLENNNSYLENAEHLLKKEDFLYLQYFLLYKAQKECDLKKRYDLLLQALHLTQPNWTPSDFANSCYSQCELKILCNLGIIYSCNNSISSASSLLYQLLDFISSDNMDVLAGQRISPMVLSSSARHFCRHKAYHQLLDLSPKYATADSCSSISHLAYFFAHYSQAALEITHNTTEATLYINYTIYNFKIIENNLSLNKYKTILSNDYAIDLL